MKPVRKLVTSLKLIVFVTVCLKVYLDIRSIPSASNMIAMYINYLSESFLFTYATPIMLDKLIAPIQKPVIAAKTNEQYANSHDAKSTAVILGVKPQ